MTDSYLKEAALLEDIGDELIQMHETLVVADMMGENREHHGVLWRTERIDKQGKKGRQERKKKIENLK